MEKKRKRKESVENVSSNRWRDRGPEGVGEEEEGGKGGRTEDEFLGGR
jgi:hypothetical protein